MTGTQKLIALVISGAGLVLPSGIATAGPSSASSYSNPLISAYVSAGVGSGKTITVVQSSRVNGAAIGVIGNGNNTKISQIGSSNSALQVSIGALPLGIAP